MFTSIKKSQEGNYNLVISNRSGQVSCLLTLGESSRLQATSEADARFSHFVLYVHCNVGDQRKVCINWLLGTYIYIFHTSNKNIESDINVAIILYEIEQLGQEHKLILGGGPQLHETVDLVIL